MSEATKQTDVGKDKPTTSSKPSQSITEKLTEFVNASHLKFAWFIGNLTVVISFFGYLFSYRSDGPASVIWYKLLFTGAVITFSIVIYQNKNLWTKGSISHKIRALLQDDNTHYLYNALIWLVFPKRSLSVIPYFAFSIFHVLSVLGFELLPILGVASPLSNKLQVFVKKYHELSRRVAATSELLLLIWLIIRLVTWRKWSLVTLALYSVFIKLKSEGSLFTQQILKNWEVRIDGLVSSPSVPPQLKHYWGSIKSALKKANSYSIIQKVEQQAEKIAHKPAEKTSTFEKKD